MRQVLASLLITAAVFTLVMLMGNILREVLSYLVNRQISMSIFAEAVGLLIPFVWVFALPMGMLTATLLIFGRFSADQELTAVRASGVSLISLVSPILLLSLALCGVSALVNMEVAPRCRVAYKGLFEKLKKELANMQFPEGRVIREFPGYICYVGKNKAGQNLEDVIVYHLERETNVVETLRAPRGHYEFNPTTHEVTLDLTDAVLIQNQQNNDSILRGDITVQLVQPTSVREQRPRVDEMTFGQLCEELRKLERLNDTRQLPQGKTAEEFRTQSKRLRKPSADLATPVRVQIHRQIAFSFACFGFTLVGIPLGVSVHRRETNVGIAIALVLVAVYYSFVMVGLSLETRPEFAPHLILWVPNFLFQAAGMVLLWRANRGT